jgi:hypothetical protein
MKDKVSVFSRVASLGSLLVGFFWSGPLEGRRFHINRNDQ